MLTILKSFDIFGYVKIFFRIFKEPFCVPKVGINENWLNPDVHPLAILHWGHSWSNFPGLNILIFGIDSVKG